MHSIDLKHEFLQLRARGATLSEIAELFEVPKSTLGVWNRQLRPEINRLRALEWELFETEFGCSLEDNLKALAKRIRRFEDALDNIPIQSIHPKDWLRVIQHCRRDYLKFRSILLAPLDEPPPRQTRLLPRPEPPPAKLYEIVRSDDSSDPEPHNTNDLQQSDPEPSNSITPDIPAEVSVAVTPAAGEASRPNNPSSLRAKPRCETNSNSRGHCSSQASANPAPSSADAVQDSKTPNEKTIAAKLITALKHLQSNAGSPRPSPSPDDAAKSQLEIPLARFSVSHEITP